MTSVSHGKPCAGNPHARFEEGASAPESPRRNALLHNIMETEDGNVLVSIPIRFQTVCGRRRLVVAGQGEVNDIDLDESGTLIRLFARAREWTRLLETGAFGDVKELAEGLKMDRPYVVRVLRLANLSPKILRAVIAKTLPDDFSTERLFNIKSDLWSEQEREIGLA